MKSIFAPELPVVTRWQCRHCGLTSEPHGKAWPHLTAVSYSGATPSDERRGHMVALELCRPCVRTALRAWLCMESDPEDTAAFEARQRREAEEALRSLRATQAFLEASNARLAAWRSTESFQPGMSA